MMGHITNGAQDIGWGDMTANQSLQPTANPLRGLSAAELGRYAAGPPTENRKDALESPMK